mmetsp:Transcript_28194/g.91119  ORF Transcript_28194/g.91119 Transcript_28194/m.91119 type:complete len:392 (+) Transcript_28194:36-1211(+)
MSAAEETKDTEQQVEDLSNSDVVTKYRTAAEITNKALQGVITQCVAGKDIAEICKFGDTLIERQTGMIFKSKKIDKGIAFPTCISVNECLSHFSPLKSESTTLNAGDLIKIDLGCHIDGYIAVVGHTMVVGESGTPTPALTGPAADVVMAAHVASEVAHKTIKPGAKNTDVTKAIVRVAEEFGVTPMHGVVSHRLKRFVIEGNEHIPMFVDPEVKTEEFDFEANEVYAVDVMFSTGEGKPREREARTTVFKRAVEQSYKLKMKASRTLLTEVNKKFPSLPFTISSFEDERVGKMGVVECVKHELLTPYPVLYERAGTHVAHFKFTALLMPSGTLRVTGLPFDAATVQTDKTPSEETAKVLSTSAKRKKRRGKKKGKAEGEGEAKAEAEAEA